MLIRRLGSQRKYAKRHFQAKLVHLNEEIETAIVHKYHSNDNEHDTCTYALKRSGSPSQGERSVLRSAFVFVTTASLEHLVCKRKLV